MDSTRKKKMADYVPLPLPQHILVDIFTRLPIKAILRCTSVCKPWKSLIKNPSFILSHLNRLQSQTTDLFLVRTCHPESGKELYSLHHDRVVSLDEYAKLDLPFDRAVNPYYRIVGSCNGVLCLADDRFTIVHNTILWNPRIRKWVSLPMPRVTSVSHPGFDDQTIGFGYDAKSNDYKVVRIVHENLGRQGIRIPPEVDVYTLSTGTWRNISHLSLQCIAHFRQPQTYVNGAVHWTGLYEDEYYSVVVVSFHIGDEVFRILEAPDVGTMSMYAPCRISLAVICGSLSLVEYHELEHSWCIWVMKEYGMASSWTILFEIETESFDRVIGFRKNGELLFATKGDLISYDPIAEQAKEVGIRSHTGDQYEYSFHVESYTESLVLLGSHVQTEDDEEDEVGSEEVEMTTKQEAHSRVMAGVQDQGEEAKNG